MMQTFTRGRGVTRTAFGGQELAATNSNQIAREINMPHYEVKIPANAMVIKTKVAGVTMKNEDGERRQDVLAKVSDEEILELMRDQFNLNDENAIEVHSVYGQIGFVPRAHAAKIAPLIDQGYQTFCVVLNTTGGLDKSIGCNIQIFVYCDNIKQEIQYS